MPPRARSVREDEGDLNDAVALDPEERAYVEAQRRADEKLRFVRKLGSYVGSVVLLGIFLGRFIAGAVAIWWGIGIVKHAFAVFGAPRLRERWIEQEVRQRVSRDVRHEREVLAAEHTRSLEHLSASIAHDLRNPIAAARSLVQQMGEDPHSPENVDYARLALDELGRVERSISHLLRFARDEALQPRTLRIGDVLDGAAETLRERITRLGVRIDRRFDGNGELVADPEQLRRIFGNLLSNALDAMETVHTTAPTITLSTGQNLAGTDVWASVRDNGPGMAPDVAQHIFEPFFTSKSNGTGLGLAVTKKLVESHGGTIEVHSIPAQGTEFVLTLPRRGAEAAARPA